MQMHPDFDEIRDSDDFHNGQKNSLSGYKMHCTTMTTMHVLLHEQLICTKLTWVFLTKKSNQIKMQLSL